MILTSCSHWNISQAEAVELKKAHGELQRRVEERTAELAVANKQLSAEIEERKQTGLCSVQYIYIPVALIERKYAERQIDASLREKEVFLKEVHHRVKKNLQTISSLLDLSSVQTNNQKTIGLCKEMRARIHTMGLIHILLYRSERFDNIDMGSYVKELVGHLSQTFGKNQVCLTLLSNPQRFIFL